MAKGKAIESESATEPKLSEGRGRLASPPHLWDFSMTKPTFTLYNVPQVEHPPFFQEALKFLVDLIGKTLLSVKEFPNLETSPVDIPWRFSLIP